MPEYVDFNGFVRHLDPVRSPEQAPSLVLPACPKCRTRFDPAGEDGQGSYRWRGRQPCFVCKRKRQRCEKVGMNAAKRWVAMIEHRNHRTAWERLLDG